ncbi:MAG: glycosyltransferase [Lentisphaerae bacterium]|nr:glycosyltransferase [Lentisphaerota bacterium]MBT4815914.1 glycosyltransferase [Lentisphaerota bacterium]MBT5611611.1 glycosyltransferase [Lentisphaerota bacterium]MBT7061710.1 glycosyltransferase [Lentisphaerota bacterium]MBT7846556.1 glycosyltransferase [Lentisphaerota bacterium]
MRILILNTDYDAFLAQFYANNPALKDADYETQMQARSASLFGVADFYSHNLRALGHDAREIHANNQHLQAAWARENTEDVTPPAVIEPGWHASLQALRRRLGQTGLRHVKRMFRPFLNWLDSRNDWLYDILDQQIRHYRPDVILNQALDGISNQFLAERRDQTRLLVGQIAAPLPPDADLLHYDLMLSSLPNYVARFRELGLRAELHRFAFDPRVLERVPPAPERDLPVSFVGSASFHHRSRGELLEALCRGGIPLEIWGQGRENLRAGSPLKVRHHGPVWGSEMYGVLARSKIALNHHIGIAGEYCNNMRLFEATGMGAALVTDAKSNLSDYFAIGTEVLAYHSADECAELIKECLDQPGRCAAIGTAGQARVLHDYTYEARMAELMETLQQYL